MISDQECSIRVVIRVRPLLEVDGPQASSTLLATDPEQPGGIRLRSPSDQRTDKQYAFDSVLGPSSTQVSADLKQTWHASTVRPAARASSRGPSPCQSGHTARAACLALPGAVWDGHANVLFATPAYVSFYLCVQDDMCASVRVDQLASSVLDGYHATVLAYGQTGSGGCCAIFTLQFAHRGLSKDSGKRAAAFYSVP